MNDCKFLGRLVKDPELKYTPDGSALCNFSMAVNRDYKNAEGKYDADFFNFTAWKKTGEIIQKYVKKGNRLLVNGSLRNRKYQANDGTTKTITFINVNSIEFIEKFDKSKQEQSKPQQKKQEDDGFDGMQFGGTDDIDFEDVPF